MAIERYYENSLPPVREVNKVASSIMTCDGWKVCEGEISRLHSLISGIWSP